MTARTRPKDRNASRHGGWTAAVAALAFALFFAASAEPMSAPASILVLTAAYNTNAEVDLLQRFAAAAAGAETAIADCGDAASACVARELDHYADWIEGVSPELAASMQGLPSIVRRAAEGVRTARSKSEALQAIGAAIGDIRGRIDLLRVEDPDAKAQATREGSLIVDTLASAHDNLERATKL